MRRSLFLIIFLFVSLATFSINSKRYHVEHITSAEGLPGNTIRDIEQDRAGFLWMAGTGGVARYDGYRFVPFNRFGKSSHMGIPRHIGQLTLSPDTTHLWISTATYNQACYDLEQGRYVDYTGRGDEERPYRKILETKSGAWMTSKTYGLRHVIERNGVYVTRDYTVQNHGLSSNHVVNVVKDGNGIIWVSTDKGLTRIDKTGKAKTYLKGRSILRCVAGGDRIMAFQKSGQIAYIFSSDGMLLHRTVLPIAIGHIGAIRGAMVWQGKFVIFSNVETFALDMRTGVFTKPAEYQIENGSEIAVIDGLHFVGNQSGNLWIFTEQGQVKQLNLFNNTAKTRERNTIFKVVKGNDGLYYIGSYGGGLFVYDYEKGSISRYTAFDRDPLIFSNYILYVFTDRSGCIWVATENGGVSKLTPSSDMADYYLIDADRQGDWTNAILNILPQGKDNERIMIETRDLRLYNFSLSSATYDYKGEIEHIISDYIIDRHGHVWETTRGDGLHVDGKRMQVVADNMKLETIDYTSITIDHKGRIWLGTWGQGLLLVKSVSGNRVRTHGVIINQSNESRITDIKENNDGYLYAATLNGLYVIDPHAKDIKVRLYSLASGNFPSDEVNCIMPGKHHDVWVGTIGAGLVRCDLSKGIDNMTYNIFTTRDGLTNDNIRSLIYDRKGTLWIGTDDGLSCVDTKDNYISRYNLPNQVLGNTFSRQAAILLHDGRLAFGTANGLVVIDPRKDTTTRSGRTLNPPLISDIIVNGASIYEGLDSVVTESSLSNTKNIKFSYSQNSLTFYFSSCNYRELSSQSYQYYLEGLDKGWRSVTSENHAEYSYLPPGSYVFHLRLVTPQNNSNETVLKIRIAQPWYNTTLAWIIYVILIASIVLWLYRNAHEKLRMHQQVTLEKQMSKFRTDFFTHVTHEFRTPLAILRNSIDHITKSPSPSHKDMQTAERGVRRMERLVNQFLEYRRMESGKLHINVERDNVIAFVQDIFLDFRNVAEKKDITLSFSPFAKEYKVLFDKQIVESVIYNLISNAIKYTQEKGNIVFSVRNDLEKKELLFTVEDNGPGIENERRYDLFRPFMEGNVSKNGMGIGLYTSYNIAKLHHGSLTYDPVTPHGSRFTFAIPDNDSVYSEDEYAAEPTAMVMTDDDSHYDEIIKEMAPKALNNQLVAIVEDDPDMQEQIAGEVGVYFKTVVYGNGNSAVEGIAKSKPNLILCDIMLPDINGYEVVKKIKSNADLAQVPIIMLTALDDESHQIKGYQVGADDYMVKPCNYHLLIARMIQLIKWRGQNNVKTSEQKGSTSAQPTVVLTSHADELFKSRINVLVAKHLGDPSFSVDRLAEMMSMGRTTFFGRVKEVFGMSPNKYITKCRMEEAARLLDDDILNIAEISYKVGFNDPTYFNRCFKAQYGIAPSKYKKR